MGPGSAGGEGGREESLGNQSQTAKVPSCGCAGGIMESPSGDSTGDS